MPKSVQIIGSEGDVLELDNTTPGDKNRGRLIFIDEEQHRVNAAQRFSLYDYDNDVDNFKYWHMKTPADPIRVFLRWQITASKSGLLEGFRDPTLTDDGTELEAFCERQCSPSTPSLKVFKNISGTDDGTRIAVFVVGSDSQATVGGAGGAIDRGRLLVLRPSTSYLAKFTAQDTNTRVALELHFFEIDGSN